MTKKISCFLLSLILTSSLTVSTVLAAEKTDDKIYEGVKSYVNEVYINLNAEDKSDLIQELYQEKMSYLNESNAIKSNAIKSRSARMIKEQPLDINIEMNNKEENYIVTLINSRGQKTTLSDWKLNLQYLQENYDSIKQIKDVNLDYVNSYIQAYEFVKLSESQPTEKVSNKRTRRSANYDAWGAVSYANTYALSYNPNYSNWDNPYGDCANFVSQCLYAGGKSMKGSTASDFSSWFSYGTSQSNSQVSSTWRGADAFKWYWQSNATSYKTFTSISSTSWDYGFKGDAVSFLNSNGRALHTMIIVGSNLNPDFTLAGHSTDTKDASLNYKMKNGGYSSFIIYNMR